jgi:MFS family permease
VGRVISVRVDKESSKLKIIILLLMAFSLMSYLDRTIISVAGPTMMKEFELSPIRMGALYSAFILSYAVLMVPAGYLADRFGPFRVLAFSGFGAALFTALTAAASVPAWRARFGIFGALLVMRLGLGLCTAPLYPASGRLIALRIPAAQHARAQGFVIAAAPLGAAVTPVVFTWFIDTYGWRLAFYCAAALTFGLTVAWLRYGRPKTASDRLTMGSQSSSSSEVRFQPGLPEPEARSWWRFLANKKLLLLTAGYFALAYFEYIFFYWIYYYFQEVRHLSSEATAWSTAILLLTMMTLIPLGGWISDRLTGPLGNNQARRTVGACGMLFGPALLYLGLQVRRPVFIVALLALALGFASAAEGPFWASAMDLGGEYAGTTGGILNAGGNFGGLLAPVVTPWIAARAGWEWGLYAGSLVALGGAMTWFFSYGGSAARLR